MNVQAIARRKLMQYLAASPLLAPLIPAKVLAATRLIQGPGKAALSDQSLFSLIQDPLVALDAFVFERIDKQRLTT
ncbi:hypothetical protein [Aliiglaciecola litoralis]|uniref:Uncharacterized protein n=1 Tax=Aliiglaciecola litoralis TaxID=582857 RepID=A0ABN1LCT9_9ALTE